MEELFLRVVTLSLTSSAVLLPLLLLAPRLRRRYAARTFYVLWLLLALRRLLPVRIPLPTRAETAKPRVYDHAEETTVPTIFLGSDAGGTTYVYLSYAMEDVRLGELDMSDEVRARWEQMEENLQRAGGPALSFADKIS